MDFGKIRLLSKKLVCSLGYPFNPNLPFIDPIILSRTTEEVTGRILAMNVSIACSYGFPKVNALDWLEKEGIKQYLCNSESDYLHDISSMNQAMLQWQVESLWALTWAAGYHTNLDFKTPCSNDFVYMFPNLKSNESSNTFRQSCKLRPAEDIAKKIDAAYCLHWGINQLYLTGQHRSTKERLSDQMIVERRRGLEWLVSDCDWDSIPLDT